MKDPEDLPGLDWRDHFGLAVVLVLMLLATAAGVLYVRQQQRTLAQGRLERAASEYAHLVELELELDLQAVGALPALFAASERVEAHEFAIFTSLLLQTRPAMRAMAYAQRVLPDERELELAALREQLGDDFVVRRPDDRAIAPEDTLYPVIFVEPPQTGMTIIGLDHYAAGARREAVRAARDTGDVAATDPLQLANDGQGQRGLLLFQPVYHGPVPATLEERRASLAGVASGVLNTPDLVGGALGEIDTRGRQIHLFDLGVAPGQAYLASWPPRDPATEPPVPQEILGLPAASAEIVAAGHSWILIVTPEGGVLRLDARWPLAAALVGLALTLAVGAYLGTLLRQRRESVQSARRLRQANAELEVVQRRLDLGQRLSSIAFWEWDVDRDELWWSEELYRMHGLDPARTRLDHGVWMRGIDPDDREHVERFTREQLQGDAARYTVEHGVLRPDGTRRQVYSDVEIERAGDGRARKLRGTVRDITEELAARERRRQLEEQLRHSQRLEAVGQLTGGVAHDFGQLLHQIGAQLSAAEEALPDAAHPVREQLERARDASQRGAQLVRQLLAFSRRQALDPRVLDIAAMLEGMAPKLQAELGSIVRLKLELPGDLWPVRLDEPQLQQAVANIARNARDAMPAGGVLRVEARNETLDEPTTLPGQGEVAPPGDHVVLAFHDQGEGMDEETAQRALEPFFTTRPPGGGAGLGLSMVHGFVRQSGGFVRIDSVVDEGTTVSLWLPRHREG